MSDLREIMFATFDLALRSADDEVDRAYKTGYRAGETATEKKYKQLNELAYQEGYKAAMEQRDAETSSK